MIQKMVRSPVAAAVAAMSVLAGISVVAALAANFWASLTPIQKLITFVVGVVVAVVVVDRVIKSIIGLSPLAGAAWMIRGISNLGRPPKPKSGQEEFAVGSADWLNRSISGSPDGAVPIDDVMMRDADHPKPNLDRGTSTALLGQSGTGKSKTAKAQLQAVGYPDPVMAHGLVQPADADNIDPEIPTGTTEWLDFFKDEGLNVESIGAENSSIRWNPFLDMRQDLRDFSDLAEGLYFDPRAKETGWDESGRSMLQAILILTDAEYGDIAHLSKVMDGYDPDEIIEKVGQIPDGERAVSSLRHHDDDDLTTIYSRVDNRISDIMECDICNDEIPAVSLREFFTGGGADVVTLENRTDARYAKSFWSFLITQANDMIMNTAGNQLMLLDEVDKLPRIPNLDDLASAGRSADARAMVIVQSVSQLEEKYGENGARSIWGNCVNRFAFRPATAKSADFALSSIGEKNMTQQTVSSHTRDRNEHNISRSMSAKRPVETGDLMDLATGEALIQSEKNWWLADLKEPRI